MRAKTRHPLVDRPAELSIVCGRLQDAYNVLSHHLDKSIEIGSVQVFQLSSDREVQFDSLRLVSAQGLLVLLHSHLEAFVHDHIREAARIDPGFWVRSLGGKSKKFIEESKGTPLFQEIAEREVSLLLKTNLPTLIERMTSWCQMRDPNLGELLSKNPINFQMVRELDMLRHKIVHDPREKVSTDTILKTMVDSVMNCRWIADAFHRGIFS